MPKQTNAADAVQIPCGTFRDASMSASTIAPSLSGTVASSNVGAVLSASAPYLRVGVCARTRARLRMRLWVCPERACSFVRASDTLASACERLLARMLECVRAFWTAAKRSEGEGAGELRGRRAAGGGPSPCQQNFDLPARGVDCSGRLRRRGHGVDRLDLSKAQQRRGRRVLSAALCVIPCLPHGGA